ncbi:CCA tRNA nucleotidyltransferase [Cohnella soli]|uniref:CCA tRNA nucleotidyltransferase n=1 Tax=Cohnella soli TaxID=425005 RepID=A0ABW0HXM6_9BACL
MNFEFDFGGAAVDPLWEAGLDVVRTLEARGYQAYLVGGCVRDRLMGRKLNDIDIATSAKPDEVMRTFPRTIPTGIKHGTITVMENGIPFEVTTFRRESDYSDGRRPDEVAFVDDLQEDLARRDFTFNAMAFGSDGEIVDPFGGQDALRAGVVQCVGDAEERFGEDALRMLRAVRFAAEFGFEPLPDVWEAILRHRAKLSQVAVERVCAEWDKLMAGSGPEQGCHYLFKSGLLGYVKESLPAGVLHAAERYRLNGTGWEWDAWGSGEAVGGQGASLPPLPLYADVDVRWTALLCGIGVSSADAAELFRTLRMSGKRTDRVCSAVGLHERMAGCPEDERYEQWVLGVLDFGTAAAEDWLTATESVDIELTDLCRGWLQNIPITEVSALDVRGDELVKELGRSPGPWIAEMLRGLLEAVAFGVIANIKAELLDAAKQWLADADGRKA